MKICSAEDCDRRHYARGFCKMHYNMVRSKGTTEPKPRIANCTVDGCSSPHRARGLCKNHYQRALRASKVNGDEWVIQPKLHPTERFNEGADDECWLWTGAVHHTGYGSIDSRTYGTCMAHRFVYELHRGPIAEGMTLDHLCRNTLCVNPSHLEPVTAGENARRMMRHKMQEKRRTREASPGGATLEPAPGHK